MGAGTTGVGRRGGGGVIRAVEKKRPNCAEPHGPRLRFGLLS